MRIARSKSLDDAIQLPPAELPATIEGRKRELGALIQSALKVGADLPTREAGRRAYAELIKIDRDFQPGSNLLVAASGQLVFTDSKRRKPRAIL